jgi:hypothetical protein
LNLTTSQNLHASSLVQATIVPSWDFYNLFLIVSALSPKFILNTASRTVLLIHDESYYVSSL